MIPADPITTARGTGEWWGGMGQLGERKAAERIG